MSQLEDVFKENPSVEDIQNYKNIAGSLFNLGKYEFALEFYNYCDKHSDDKELLLHIGDTYDKLEEKETALKYYIKATEYFPNNDILFGNIGIIYADLYMYGYREEQLKYFSRAYELNPYNPTNIMNMLIVTCKFNMVEQADKYFHLVMNLKHDAGVMFSYGCFLIHNRNFEDGFKWYRYRIEHKQTALPSGLKNMWQPNIDISDKVVLVTYEQGFGDTIMFIRFVKYLKLLCKEVKVFVQGELYELLKPNFDFEIYPNTYDEHVYDNLEYDCFIPIMDLPFFVKFDLDNIPDKNGYIKIPHGENPLVKKTDKFKIGICYEGSEIAIRTGRDIPLKELYPIFDLDVEIYSFQKDDIKNQMKDVPEKYNFTRLGDTFNSWTDTAIAMGQMDLIVTTDNGVLNLAGALGVKTFSLFNKYPEFRWFTMDKDIGWYSIKPYQCKEYNGWADTVKEMLPDIQKLVDEHERARKERV